MSKKSIFATTLFTFVLFVFMSLTAYAESKISINDKNFPDQNFRECIQRFDLNHDNYLDEKELNVVTELNVFEKRMTDLKGLEFFKNLKVLNCAKNKLKYLDVSQNTKLEELYCSSNSIMELDVSNNLALRVLDANGNNLIFVDLSHNIHIERVSLWENVRIMYEKIIDMNSIPGFDMSKTSQWFNVTIDGSIVTIQEENRLISYLYDLGNGKTGLFTWNYRSIQNPTEEQQIICPSSYTKSVGDPSFNINAKATGQGRITYESDNPNVATVTSDGSVNILNAGTAIITIRAAKTGTSLPAEKKVTITVTKKQATITGLNSSYTFTYGDGNYQLPIKASGGTIHFTSSNTNVAKVSSSGNLQFTGAGKAVIHVALTPTVNYKGTSQDVIVTVLPKPLTISNVRASYSLTYGKKGITLKPQSKGKVTYTVKDKKVVTVNSNGKVTVKGSGKTTVTITATGNQNYLSASKIVTIRVKPKTLAKPKVSTQDNKKITIQWKKDSKVNGYEIYYATNTKFNKNKKVITIKKSNITKKVITPKKKSTYYIKMRSYRLVGKSKLYSDFTKTVKIRIK